MLVRNFIFWLSSKRRVTNSIARRGMKHGFARCFVAGETFAEAPTASRELCQQGRNVSLKRRGTISLNSAMFAILVPNRFTSGIKLSSR